MPLPGAADPAHPVLFYNPKSGGGKAERFKLADEARARGIEPIELGPPWDLEALVRGAIERGADALAMAGGDGSQAIVAAIAAEHDLPYACIPAGTRNHFALDLGVNRDDVVGALDAFIDGGEKRVDLAEVNGRVFVNNVSLGLYAEAVQRDGYREAKLRTILDTLPQALGPGGEGLDLHWTGPSGSDHTAGAAILVSNNRYRLGHAVGSGTRPRIDDGLLGITVVGPAQRPRRATPRPPAPVARMDGPGVRGPVRSRGPGRHRRRGARARGPAAFHHPRPRAARPDRPSTPRSLAVSSDAGQHARHRAVRARDRRGTQPPLSQTCILPRRSWYASPDRDDAHRWAPETIRACPAADDRGEGVMCRWMAWFGQPVLIDELLFKTQHGIVDQSLHSRMGAEPTNGDGFGFGWYGAGEGPGVYHSVSPAWGDANLRELAAHIESPLFIAHVRAAIGSPVQQTNCHPFRRGRWLFVHNGYLGGFHDVRRELMLAIDPELFPEVHGSTDTEVVFHLALTFGLEDDPVARARAHGRPDRGDRAAARDRGRGAGHLRRLRRRVAVGRALRDDRAARARCSPRPTSTRSASLHPDNPRLQAHDRAMTALIVSEPFSELPGVWHEIPESSAVRRAARRRARAPRRSARGSRPIAGVRRCVITAGSAPSGRGASASRRRCCCSTRATGRSANRIDDVLALLGPHAAAETHACVVELRTAPHPTAGGAAPELGSLRAALDLTLRDELGLRAGGRRHASAGDGGRRHVRRPGTRYREVEATMRVLAHREPTMAQHVHVGVPDQASAVRALDGLRARSRCCSPYRRTRRSGAVRDSGFASMRTPIFGMFPRTGIPRRFGHYAEYMRTVGSAAADGRHPGSPASCGGTRGCSRGSGRSRCGSWTPSRACRTSPRWPRFVQCLVRRFADDPGHCAAAPELLEREPLPGRPRRHGGRAGRHAHAPAATGPRPAGRAAWRRARRWPRSWAAPPSWRPSPRLAADPGHARQRRIAAEQGLAALPSGSRTSSPARTTRGAGMSEPPAAGDFPAARDPAGDGDVRPRRRHVADERLDLRRGPRPRHDGQRRPVGDRARGAGLGRVHPDRQQGRRPVRPQAGLRARPARLRRRRDRDDAARRP